MVETGNTRRLDLMRGSQRAYANDSDALANFKGCANLIQDATGLDMVPVGPELVAVVYFYKHLTSVLKHALVPEFTDREGESREGRFDDAENYLELLRAILTEKDPVWQREQMDSMVGAAG
jgi:hypothetical protein